MSLSADFSRSVWLPAAFIAAAVFVAYAPALDCGFIWDDNDYITQNEVLRTPGGLASIWLDPSSIPQYYPLVHTTYWLEYRLWQLDPAGYHATNIALHALGAVLLLLVLRKLGAPLPLLAAAIFALHPVHVESVAWVTERKNVLSAVFYFLALLSWMRWRPIGDRDDTGRGPTRFYWLSLAAFLAALLAKTVTCSLPAVLLLLIWWKRGRITRRDVAATLPFFAVGLAMALVTAVMEQEHVLAKGADWDLSAVERCLIAGRAIWFYAAKLLWPAGLSFNYTRWAIDSAAWWQYLFPAGVLAVGGALWFVRRRIGRGPLVALLVFAGSLVPALGFFNVYPMLYSFVADHFQYIASIGMIVLFCGIVERPARAALRKLAPGGGAGAAAMKLGAAGLILLVVLGFLARRQTGVYMNLETLWIDTMEKNPDSWLAVGSLGGVRLMQGKLEEAQALTERALDLREPNSFAHNNLGIIRLHRNELEMARGRPKEARLHLETARFHLETAISQRPHNPESYNNLAVVHWRENDLEGALRLVKKALAIRYTVDAGRNAGELCDLTGRKEEALEHLSRVLEEVPRDSRVRLIVARLLLKAERFREARDHFERVLRALPANRQEREQMMTKAREGRAKAERGMRGG